MGYMVRMDEFGDAEGNYTLISRKKMPHRPSKYGMYPIGIFLIPQNSSEVPVIEKLICNINRNIVM